MSQFSTENINESVNGLTKTNKSIFFGFDRYFFLIIFNTIVKLESLMKELITIISLFSLVTLFSEVHIMEISLKDTSGVVFLRDSLENNIKDQQSQHYNFEQVEFLESQKSQNSLEVKNKFQTNGDNIKLNEESTRLEIVNFPNNYNLETVTMFYLEEDSQVKIDFYNSLGEVVANLVNGKIKKGRHITKYDGVSLKSGTYYIRLEVNGEIKDLKKLILLL